MTMNSDVELSAFSTIAQKNYLKLRRLAEERGIYQSGVFCTVMWRNRESTPKRSIDKLIQLFLKLPPDDDFNLHLDLASLLGW